MEDKKKKVKTRKKVTTRKIKNENEKTVKEESLKEKRIKDSDSYLFNQESLIDKFAIKINEKIKAERKNTKSQNNPYFWILKFLILIISVFVISFLFNSIRDLGTDIIYEINKTLRSVLSSIWEGVVNFTKHVFILYFIYSNIKSFIDSPYYERLYKNDKKMRDYKDKYFDLIILLIRILAIPFLIMILLIASAAMFIFIYFLFIVSNTSMIFSPFIISISTIYIAYLAYKHILRGFFDINYKVYKNSYLLGILLVLFGSMLVFYELREFKYVNNLPVAFETTKKVSSFDISGKNKIIIKNNSKLNNIKIYKNNNLKDEIKVYVEYFDTAKVEYVYEYNNDNNLVLRFESRTHFKPKNIVDILGIIEKGLIDKTIYNFNLFKYPNIKIYANMTTAEQIFIQ